MLIGEALLLTDDIKHKVFTNTATWPAVSWVIDCLGGGGDCQDKPELL